MKFYTLDSFIDNFKTLEGKDMFIVDDLHSKDDDEFIKNYVKMNRKNFDMIAYFWQDLLVEFYYLFLDSKFQYLSSKEQLSSFIWKNKKVLLIVTDKNWKSDYTNIELISEVINNRDIFNKKNIKLLYYWQENELINCFIPNKINLIKKQNIKWLLEGEEYLNFPNNFFKLTLDAKYEF